MLADLWWRGGLLLFAVFALQALPWRISAARRHVVWMAALTSLLALPLLSPLSQWRPARVVDASRGPGVLRTVVNVIAEDPATPAARPPWAAILWAAGFVFCGARALRAQAQARRVARRARPVNAQVRLSAEVGVPMVMDGVIVMPEESAAWPPDRRAAALAHEREHLRRGDSLSQALISLICALYWPQPMVWLAARAARKECEQAADDGVLAQPGTRASAYAGHLVEIARTLASRPVAPAGGIAMTRTSQLHQRVASILDARQDRRAASRAFIRGVFALALACAAGVAALPAWMFAQGRAPFSGVVRDPSGAVVERARIDIKAEGVREVAYSSADGTFSFAGVPDGAYDLIVMAPGFARLSQTGVKFEAGKSQRFELILQMGSLRESMTIAGEASAAQANKPAANGVAPTRIRVGGNVQASKLVHQVRPDYPVAAKAAGVQGTVLLSAVVGRDGQIINLEQINKQVDARLVESALAAVRQWRYTPTLLNGLPVEVLTEIEINYTLAR